MRLHGEMVILFVLLIIVLWGQSADASRLHRCVNSGDLVCVKECLQAGESPNARMDIDSLQAVTPLYIAAISGNIGILRVLIEAGADINAKVDTLARLKIDEFSFSTDVAWGDTTVQSSWCETPLHAAAKMGNLDIVDELLNRGASVDPVAGEGNTPLFLAIVNRKLPVVEALLSYHASLNRTNKLGHLPISEACLSGSIDVVRALSKAGARVTDRDRDGQTPLHHAAKIGSTEVLQFLLDQGSPVDAKSTAKETPLLCALWWGNHAANNDVARLLLKAGANPNETDGNGRSPLMCAAEYANPALVSALLSAGANLTATTTDGWTALHYAVNYMKIEGSGDQDQMGTVRILLESGASVNARNKKGDTPLFWAIYRDYIAVAGFLLEHGADPNIRNNKGETALMVAQGHSSQLQELLRSFRGKK